MTTRQPSLLDLARTAVQEGRAATRIARDAVQLHGVSSEALASLERQGIQKRELGERLAHVKAQRDEARRTPQNWHSYLANVAVILANQQTIDPDVVVAYLRDATSPLMPRQDGEADRQRNAIPIFIGADHDTARRWKGLSFEVSQCWKDRQKGTIVGRGKKRYVPSSSHSEDEEAMRAMVRLRQNAAQRLVEEIEQACLGNLNEKVWMALWLVNGVEILDAAAFKESCEEAEGGLILRSYRNPRTKEVTRAVNCRYFKLSDEEHFLVPSANFLGGRLVAALEGLAGRLKSFWEGEMDINQMIQDSLLAHAEDVITPDEFLRHQFGVAAVCHENWRIKSRDQDKTVEGSLLLQRREGDGKWKIVVCSPEVAKSLSGNNLRFCEWAADDDLPPHLTTFIKGGVEIFVQ